MAGKEREKGEKRKKEEKKGIRKKKKERKREQEGKKERKLNQYDERAPCSFKCKRGLQGRKRQGRQIDGEKDERGPMQFQVQAGAPGEKTSGRQIDEEKDERDAMQFQMQAGSPGKKTSGASDLRRKGNQIIELLNLFPFWEIRNIVFLYSIIMMLVSFTFLLYSTTPRQCRPWSYRGKSLWYRLDKWKKK